MHRGTARAPFRTPVVPVYGVPRSFRAILEHCERICNTTRVIPYEAVYRFPGTVSTCGNTLCVTECASKALGARSLRSPCYVTAGRLLRRSLVPGGQLVVFRCG
eukprot:969087-Rhodomonas_salina.1